MENASHLLEKNKEEALDILQDILASPDLRYATNQQIIETVVLAGQSNKITKKPDHLIKYVHLVVMLSEIRSQRDHSKIADFDRIVQFFISANACIERNIAQLPPASTVKFSGSIVRGFDLSLKAREAVNVDRFCQIYEICQHTLDRLGRRETLGHSNIMGCARQLKSYGFDDANQLANQVFQLGKMRNADLIYETLQYSCIVRQSWQTLITLNPRIIPSNHVEFLPSSDFKMRFFRPSAEADVKLFVGAFALARTIDECDRDPEIRYDGYPSKRTRKSISGLFLMKLAFRNPDAISESEFMSILNWAQDNIAIEDPATIFWAFVTLGLGFTGDGCILNRLWHSGRNALQNPEYSSGACFLSSNLIPKSFDPNHISSPLINFERDVIDRITSSLSVLSSSTSAPALTSGSLCLWNAVADIKILDESFQIIKMSSSNSYRLNQLISSDSLPLLNQFFDDQVPVHYFAHNECDDSVTLADYFEKELIQNMNYGQIFNQTQEDRKGIYNTKDSFEVQLLRRTTNLRDSLVQSAIIAQCNLEVPDTFYRSHTAAFAADDSKAFAWFSGLAMHLNWPSRYTENALSLAHWDAAVVEHPGITSSFRILSERPNRVISTALLGQLHPSLVSQESSFAGSELTDLEIFMKSYDYQRSASFLKVVCRSIGLRSVRKTSEAHKLRGYLVQVSLVQSALSRLLLNLVKFGGLSKSDSLTLLQKMSNESKYQSLSSFKSDDSFDISDLASFTTPLLAASYSTHRGCFSVAKLLLMNGNSDLTQLGVALNKLNFLSPEHLYSAFMVPMFLNDSSLFTDFPLPKGVVERAQVFMKPFTELTSSSGQREIAGIVEQISKEMILACDNEMAQGIEATFLFIKAHLDYTEGSSISLWKCFILNACSCVGPRFHLTSTAFAHVIAKFLNFNDLYSGEDDEQDSIAQITAAIYRAGFEDLAFKVLRKFRPDSYLVMLEPFDILSDIGPFISKCSPVDSAESWYMIIDKIIRSLEGVAFELAYDAFGKLPVSSLKSLLAWTDYLDFTNMYWLALLGRLRSDMKIKNESSIFKTVPSLIWCNDIASNRTEEDFVNNESPNSGSLKTASQVDKQKPRIERNDLKEELFNQLKYSLENVYMMLPYTKKRVLNTCSQRSNDFSHLVYPADIFGEKKWSSEMSYRPIYSDKHDSVLNTAQEIADVSSMLIEQPQFGPGTTYQVPELISEIIPLLAAVAIANISKLTKSSLSEQKLHERLSELIESSLKSQDDMQKRFASGIFRQCVKHNVNFPLTDSDVAHACYELVMRNLGDKTDMAKLGLMAVERMWNQSPSSKLRDDNASSLRVFFHEVSNDVDHAFSEALPHKMTVPTISDITKSMSPEQQLQANMVYQEVLASNGNTEDVIVEKSFQRCGLYNSAQQFNKETNAYDLKKAWWLGQWDTYEPTKPQSEVFQHRDYGYLISFVTGQLNTIGALASLNKIRSPLVHSISDVTYKSPSQFVGNPISRYAYETLALHRGDCENYIAALVTACQHFRCENEKSKTLEYAAKLERFIIENKNSPLEKEGKNETVNLTIQGSEAVSSLRVNTKILEMARSSSHLENAHIQWMLGQQSSAITSSKALLSHVGCDSEMLNSDVATSRGISPSASHLHESPPAQLDRTKYPFDVGKIYCILGTWSHESRNEPDNAIFNSYFQKAMSYRDSQNAEYIHHSFAQFCYEAYQDSHIQMAIQNARRNINNLNPQLKQLSKIIKTGMEDFDTEKKHKSNKMYRSLHALSKSSTSDLQESQKYRKGLLVRCAENYMSGLAAGDTYEDDMATFISLWLEHHENAESNDMIYTKLGPREEESVLIPVRKFVPWISQLSSRLGSSKASPSPNAFQSASRREISFFQDALQRVILVASRMHPYHTLWHLYKISTAKTEDKREARERANAATMSIRQTRTFRPDVVDSVCTLFDEFIRLGSAKQSTKDNKQQTTLVSLLGRRYSTFWRTKSPKSQIPVPTAHIPISLNGDYSEVPVFIKIVEPIKIAGGLSAPKVLKMMDSAGQIHQALLKTSNDDLRQDAIMEQVFSIASDTLTKRHPNLYVRTYNVIPLSATIGLIEFVQNTTSLIEILESMHMKYGDHPGEFSLSQARKVMNASRQNSRIERIHVYKEVAAHTRPQMRHYWMEKFHDAPSWLDAKTRWCRSTAVMSMSGYIIGLGDRHCSNLLVDNTNGDVVHIDLGIAFDKGKLLQVPETVPFRSTRDVVDGMGICGTSGVFTRCATTTSSVLREHKARIMTVLSVLKHDTSYTWKSPVSVLRHVQMRANEDVGDISMDDDSPQVDDGQAEHASMGVKAKLQDSLSCEATVRDLMMQAEDPQNLALIYSGWCPFY